MGTRTRLHYAWRGMAVPRMGARLVPTDTGHHDPFQAGTRPFCPIRPIPLARAWNLGQVLLCRFKPAQSRQMSAGSFGFAFRSPSFTNCSCVMLSFPGSRFPEGRPPRPSDWPIRGGQGRAARGTQRSSLPNHRTVLGPPFHPFPGGYSFPGSYPLLGCPATQLWVATLLSRPRLARLHRQRLES